MQAPMVGRWSDAYGRRPFLILTFVFASLPVMVLFFNLHFKTSMYFYYPAQASLPSSWTYAFGVRLQ